ncbi:MAG TPA: HAMP domain-containing sensor histidine kinase [Dermatophilaceae bacterium]|nr:HAMP domain-containing sensor histidine kinase [Dermatophilaceae bacterium]
MNRLVVRLVISHVLVAVLGAVATFLVVRQLAPALFDESMHRMPIGAGMGQSQAGALRQQFADAVNQALLVGALVGSAAAAAFGAFAAYRLIRPLGTMGAAAREIARGRYAVKVHPPRERELAELAQDVNTLGHALAETEERRVRLLGELAHEMRTPLTVIDGYVEGMIDGVLPTTPAELGQVSDEVRRLRRLSEDLSALSRVEEGRIELSVRPVDLGKVAAAAAERLRPQADDAGIDLRVKTSGVLRAPADPDRVAQLVTNLVGNAIRATPRGGTVEVRTIRDGGDAVLAVADTGEGLDASDLERVFERFYRVAGRRGDAHDSGTGIGLTIARGIARAHGGDLSAASPGRGRGATFTARLPLSAEVG